MSGRILFCGARAWTDSAAVLDAMLQESPDVVIEGSAKGADSIARDIAKKLGIVVLEFPANWDLYGRSAGFIRNQQMLDEGKPDKVIAFQFYLAESKGTADMIKRAKKAGIPVRVVMA